MRIDERFHQPENFDKVADGHGWVMYAGGNDWESGATAAAVVRKSDEKLERVWFKIKHKGGADADTSSEKGEAIKEHGKKAWKTWLSAAKAHHAKESPDSREAYGWLKSFKAALTSPEMKPFVEEHGVERSKWSDVEENASRIVTRLLDAVDVVEPSGYDPDPNNLPGEFQTNFKDTKFWHKPKEGFKWDGQRKIWPPDEQFVPKEPVIQPDVQKLKQLGLNLEALAENLDTPDDMKSEVDRLLPVKQYRLGGNTMIHAPGVIAMAQNRWRERGAKAKKNAMDIIHAWPGLPDDVCLAILNGKCTIDTEGFTAVVTIKDY